MRTVLSTLIALTISSQAFAQELWQGATVGMSQANILAKFRSARLQTSGSTLVDKSRELVAIESYAVGHRNYRVIFYFREEKLVQVTLNLLASGTFRINMIEFERIQSLLTARYGKEISCKRTTSAVAGIANCDWFKSGINISIINIGVGDHPATLNINYQVRIKTDSDRL